jgi:hypothetical protein
MSDFLTKAKETAAKHLNESDEFTCVICEVHESENFKLYTSTERGVKPLLCWLDSGEIKKGFAAADKVVGKAAAYLYVLLGAAAVYAPVMSAMAVEVFRSYGIEASYDVCPEGIRNRTNTGPCPMESAVADIDTPEEALIAIKDKIKNMKK